MQRRISGVKTGIMIITCTGVNQMYSQATINGWICVDPKRATTTTDTTVLFTALTTEGGGVFGRRGQVVGTHVPHRCPRTSTLSPRACCLLAFCRRLAARWQHYVHKNSVTVQCNVRRRRQRDLARKAQQPFEHINCPTWDGYHSEHCTCGIGCHQRCAQLARRPE